MLKDVDQLGGPQVVDVRRFGDQRGYFCETYNAKRAEELGIHARFVQDNESLSAPCGTVRGLHYQRHPHAQGKLVRVVVGAILDVVVDIRTGSPTFGDYGQIGLDSEDGRQLWIPPGFAHGFCTLRPDTIINYKVTDFYNAEADRSMRWDDPQLGIQWPSEADADTLSPKDSDAPLMADLHAMGELFQ